MRALWSRAGTQAHACRCRGCSTALNGVGRRAEAAARRRNPTFAELFTACYSSMFASAAIIDAMRKEDRRQELDQKLEHARQELADLQHLRQVNEADSDLSPAALTVPQMDDLWNSLKTIVQSQPLWAPAKALHNQNNSRISRRYMADLCLGEPQLAALREIDHGRIERAILYEEQDPTIIQREPMNEIQIQEAARSAQDLITRLLGHAQRTAQTCSTPSPSLDEARLLMRKGYPHYTNRAFDPRRAVEHGMQLNHTVKTIIDNPKLNSAEKLGRVCYNLLVSPYPSGMHTYNTLLNSFSKNGLDHAAHSVSISFFYRRLLMPTPATYVSLLNHDIKTGNYRRFMSTIACITGMNGTTGGKLRSYPTCIVDSSQDLCDWAGLSPFRTRHKNHVSEHVPLTRHLVDTMISGLVQFKLFDQAALLFLSALETGVRVSTKSLLELFDGCVSALSWRSAQRLIQAFVRDPALWPSAIEGRETHAVGFLLTRLFALWEICGKTHISSLSPAALTGLDASEAQVRRLGTVIRESAGSLAIEIGLTKQEATSESPWSVRCRPISKELPLYYKSLTYEIRQIKTAIRSVEHMMGLLGYFSRWSPTLAIAVADSKAESTSFMIQRATSWVEGNMVHPYEPEDVPKNHRQRRRLLPKPPQMKQEEKLMDVSAQESAELPDHHEEAQAPKEAVPEHITVPTRLEGDRHYPIPMGSVLQPISWTTHGRAVSMQSAPLF